VIEQLIGEQYQGKEKLLRPNIQALHLGRDWALKNLKCSLGLRFKRADAVKDRIFVEGNAAAALGAVYGGATVCAWYPITPSSSLADAFTRYCARLRVDPESKKHKYAIVQAEDELASIGVVIGAAWNGARAFTATSGPGISLMQEFIGLAYFAEIPAVIFDVQRSGPSTGMPTRTQQTDIISCAYASHGDTKHVLLFPEDPHECFVHAAAALDLADRLDHGELDLAIGETSALGGRFNDRRLFHDRLVALMRQGHPASAPGALTLSTLAALPHLEAVYSDERTKFIDQALARENLSRRVVLRAPLYAVSMTLLDTDTVAVICERAARNLMRLMPLAIAPLPFPSPDLTTAMTWHRRYGDSARLRWLRQVVIRVARACEPPLFMTSLSLRVPFDWLPSGTRRRSDFSPLQELCFLRTRSPLG